MTIQYFGEGENAVGIASDTPETDAAIRYDQHENKYVEPDFARKLERQRNELLGALDHIARLAHEGAVDLTGKIQYACGDIAVSAIAKIKEGK